MGADADQNMEIEMTERGSYCLPRALELSDAMPELRFWDCLSLARQEYDTLVQ